MRSASGLGVEGRAASSSAASQARWEGEGQAGGADQSTPGTRPPEATTARRKSAARSGSARRRRLSRAARRGSNCARKRWFAATRARRAASLSDAAMANSACEFRGQGSRAGGEHGAACGNWSAARWCVGVQF